MRKFIAYFMVLVVLAVYFKLSEWQYKKLNKERSLSETKKEECVVKGIIDGNTFLCSIYSSEVRVKLVGVDVSRDPRLAEKALKSLLKPGDKVLLETDVKLHDEKGNLLAYVFKEGIMINERMLREGSALLDTSIPYMKYMDVLAKAQQQAIKEGAGVWKSLHR